MAKRKTVNVEALLQKFNNIMAHPDVKQEAKIGIATAAETLLFEADRYAGFRFLHMTYNAKTERYDVDPDTEYSRQYFCKEVK